VIAPWTVRNELRLHAFVPVSTNTWAAFWLVNNPQADGRYRRPEAYIGVARVREIRSLPELKQEDEWRHMALTWVRAHPVAAMKGWIRDDFFFVSDPDPLLQQWYGLHGLRPFRVDERFLLPLALLAGSLGLWVSRGKSSAGIGLITLLYTLVFFAFFLPIPRYRAPTIAVVCALAAGLPEVTMAAVRRVRTHEEIVAQ
jgi:hypothetical protein